jgi:hypothetical protein
MNKLATNSWLQSILLAILLAVVAVGCATTSDSLRTSSLRLEDRAQEFSTSVRYQGDDSYRDRVSRDADALAAAARDLNRAVDGGTSSERVRDEFDRVSREYERLQRDLADEGFATQNRRVLQDFDRVTDAYRGLQDAMDGRYARADRTRY